MHAVNYFNNIQLINYKQNTPFYLQFIIYA